MILDSQLRLPLESRLLQSVTNDGSFSSDVLVFCSSGKEEKKKELEARGIRVEQLPPGTGRRPDIPAILRRLGQLEITSVMIEGGAAVNGSALSSGIVDKIFFYYAPKIFAAEEAVPLASGIGHLEEALRIKDIHLHRFGEDFAVEGYLRNPYED